MELNLCCVKVNVPLTIHVQIQTLSFIPTLPSPSHPLSLPFTCKLQEQ